MPYTRSYPVWKGNGDTTTPITPASLQNIEDGIVAAYVAGTGGLVNADLAAGAAVDYSKLALAGSIVNADVSASAALAASKLAGYPSDATKVLTGGGTWVTPPGGKLSYVEIVANASINATTIGTANTVVTAPALTFDGSTEIKIEFGFANARPAANDTIDFALYDGASAPSNKFGRVSSPAAAALDMGATFSKQFTPAAGTRTYSIRAYVSTSTGTVFAVAGTWEPTYIRITKV